MKTKEEVIKEAYGNDWIRLSEQTRDLALNNYGRIPFFKLEKYSSDSPEYIDCSKGFIVPKSLQGIEDNNGWIKIESEADLPKEEFNSVWIKHNDGDVLIIQCSNKYLLKNTTHYQPLIKPKPPIY